MAQVFVQHIFYPYFENMKHELKLLENQKNDLVYILLVNAQVRHISFMVEDWIPSHLFLLALSTKARILCLVSL